MAKVEEKKVITVEVLEEDDEFEEFETESKNLEHIYIIYRAGKDRVPLRIRCAS